MENTVLVPLSGFNEYRDVIGRELIDPEVMYLFPPSLRELCPETCWWIIGWLSFYSLTICEICKCTFLMNLYYV